MAHRYSIIDGLVQTYSLEAHIVDHCNLRCAMCCSLSPFLPPRWTSPEALARDLAVAVTALRPRIFKLVGGEPLLHPRLVDCLEVARASGIAPLISVTTNGLLLHRMPRRFWEAVDAMTISLYPWPELAEAHQAKIRASAEVHGVVLNWKHQSDFIDMTRSEPSADRSETEATYAGCWLRERCHMIGDGMFFTCTRPPHFATLLGERSSRDGIALRPGPDLGERIHGYLTRSQSLATCARCRGGHAPSRRHRQLSRVELSERELS